MKKEILKMKVYNLVLFKYDSEILDINFKSGFI